MSNIFDNRLNSILKNNVTPLLKEVGFSKRRLVYVKDIGEISWLVDIQKSRWNDEVEAQFTLNCGVYVPDVLSTYANMAEPTRLKIEHCCCSARIGMLIPEKRDLWWKLRENDPATSNNEIGQDLQRKLKDFVIPFLSKVDQRARVADFLSSDLDAEYRYISPRDEALRLAYSAIIYSKIDEKRKANNLLDFAIKVSAKSPGAEFISRLKQKI